MSIVRTVQKNSEMSAVFDLSLCTATAGNPTVGNEYILLGFFCLGGGDVRKKSTKRVRVQVNAEKMITCSYVQAEKNPYLQDIS